MIKTSITLSTMAMALALFSACGNNTDTAQDDDLVIDSSAYQSQGAIQITDAGSGQDFPDATLSMSEPTVKPAGDSVELTFNFNVSNYTLGMQTPDAQSRGCANSKDGQHIHFILNNAPYTALYKPTHTVKVAKGQDYNLLCFLSRSYHESIKHPGAAQTLFFKIDADGLYHKRDSPSEPMLFYSRPKGDYVGKDTANLLLDYYIWNGTLGSDLKVKADITNKATGSSYSQIFDSWKPMIINGLGTGNAEIVLQLQDATGNIRQSASREFTLSAAEPLP